MALNINFITKTPEQIAVLWGNGCGGRGQQVLTSGDVWKRRRRKKKEIVGSQTQPPSAGPFPPQLQCFQRSRCWWERTKNGHFFVLSGCNEVRRRGNEKNLFVSTRWLNQDLLCVYTRFMFKTETNRPQTSEWVISFCWHIFFFLPCCASPPPFILV